MNNAGEGGEDLSAALDLLTGLGQDTVEEFQMKGTQPGGSTADMAAVKVEDSSNADHDTEGKMGQKPLHELFLLGGSERNPNDIRSNHVEFRSNGPVVEFIYREEGKRHEGHVYHCGVPRGNSGTEVVQNFYAASKKSHAVMTGTYYIPEYLRSAVMLPANAVKITQEGGNPGAVADGKHGF